MNKKLGVLLAAALIAAPAASFAYTDCRDIGTPDGCSVEQLVQISGQNFLSIGDRISALQMAIQMLLSKITQLKPQTSTSPASCLDLTQDLYIGKTDTNTKGEVSKLQRFLGPYSLAVMDPMQHSGIPAEELVPVTGYYGEKTAAAVVKWQKAHGMDFVTAKSGVGPMTRSKIKCGTASSTVEKIKWTIVPANPSITSDDDYRKYEQSISIEVTFKNDGLVKQFTVGKAYGCAVSDKVPTVTGKKILGFVNCYMALTGTAFTAYEANGKFIVERGDESAKDGSVKTTVVVEI